MCMQTTPACALGAHGRHQWVKGEAGDVVDDHGSRVERSPGDFRPSRIDGDRRGHPARDALDDGQDPPQLLLLRDRSRARPGRFPADIDEVGPSGDEFGRMVGRAAGIEEAASVREAVRSDIHDPHDLRGFAELPGESCKAPREKCGRSLQMVVRHECPEKTTRKDKYKSWGKLAACATALKPPPANAQSKSAPVGPCRTEDKPYIRQHPQNSQKSEISSFWFDFVGSVGILKATNGKLDTAYAVFQPINAFSLRFQRESQRRDRTDLLPKAFSTLSGSVSNQGVWSFSECTRLKCSTR